MSEPLKVAVAGLGRMGVVHALHLCELASEGVRCAVAALADSDLARAQRVAAELDLRVPVFSSVEELAAAGVCNATVVVTPTGIHRETAWALISKGHRILLEKPLTGDVNSDRGFAADLDRHAPESLMLAFQRRFDAPLQYAKDLMDGGAIGRVFKICSSMEDSNPAPDGYQSGGLLADMAIHNVDEVLWLSGQMPRTALAVGTRIYSHRLTTCREDFDDALLYLWFAGQMVAQVQVGRNHVSGYRCETLIFGEEGQIHVGHFDQKPLHIVVEAYGRRGRSEPLAHRAFPMRDYGRALPEFVDRFGLAYKAELAVFIECCRSGAPFPATHRDGLRAQEVIAAGMRALVDEDRGAPVPETR